DGGDDEDEDSQPQERGGVLHEVEGGEPEDQGDENGRDRVPHQVGEAGDDLQDQGHAGDLNDQGEHVDDESASEGDQAKADAKPLTDDVEERAARGDGHAAGHVGVDDYPEDPNHDRPDQCETVPRSGLRARDQLAHVDEAADGSDDA